jgi:thiosulfate/3-mercaptopyruvate sulfurtransferase
MLGSGRAGAEAGSLVSTEWLAARLGGETLVILHVGSARDFDAGHIPGARLVEVGDVSASNDPGLRVELPPLGKLEETFARLGIGDQSSILLYSGTASYQLMTRVYFTLDYLGAWDRTKILDGGLAVWRAEGLPVTTVATPAAKANFTGRPRPELVVDAAWIKENAGRDGVALLDARTPEFFTGASAGSMPRAGRIPGARNVPFTAIVDPSGKFRSREELQRMFRDAGIEPGATVVTYCHIGLQATVLYWVAQSLGHSVRLYDGSFQDWSRQAELPVETGSSSDP